MTHEELSVSVHAILVRRAPPLGNPTPQAEPSGFLGDYVCRCHFTAIHGISFTRPLIRSTERQLHAAGPAVGLGLTVVLPDLLGQVFVKLAARASSSPVQAVLCQQHCHHYHRGRNKDGTSMKLPMGQFSSLPSQPISTEIKASGPCIF